MPDWKRRDERRQERQAQYEQENLRRQKEAEEEEERIRIEICGADFEETFTNSQRNALVRMFKELIK